MSRNVKVESLLVPRRRMLPVGGIEQSQSDVSSVSGLDDQ